MSPTYGKNAFEYIMLDIFRYNILFIVVRYLYLKDSFIPFVEPHPSRRDCLRPAYHKDAQSYPFTKMASKSAQWCIMKKDFGASAPWTQLHTAAQYDATFKDRGAGVPHEGVGKCHEWFPKHSL
jgi:hypothetical protein